MPTTTERSQSPVRRTAVFTAQIRAMDEESRTVSALVSTVSPDRHGSIILPSAWRLDQYRKNPVVLWGHRWEGGPDSAIGTCSRLDPLEGQGLQAELQYAVEANPTAQLVWDLMAAGVLRAYSPGFYVHDCVDQIDLRDERMKDKVAALPDYARQALQTGEVWEVITDAELLELSNVLIGSNPDALAKAVQAGVVPREMAGRALEDLGLDERSAVLRRFAGRKEEPMDTDTPAPEEREAESGLAELEGRVAGLERKLDELLACREPAPEEPDLEAMADAITEEILAELLAE